MEGTVMDSCMIIIIHYFKSALHTSGRVPFSMFSVAWFLRMCQLSNRHHVVVCRWWSMTSALVRSSGWPVSQVCSARADAATSPFFRAHWCSASRMYPLWHLLQGKRSIQPPSVHQWYQVFGVYQHVAEGAQWTKDHLDVQPCEDPSHCLRENDVGLGYSHSGFPFIHFLSLSS